MRHILLYLRNVFKYAREYLCVDNEIFLKYDNLFVVIDILNREKFLRLTMGFGYLMYSHSLVPVIDLLVRVVTKLVSEQWFSLLILKLSFCDFLTLLRY